MYTELMTVIPEVPDSDKLLKWAEAIATIIILVNQFINKSKQDAAKQHAQDAATVGVQTFHLVNGQMSSQLLATAKLANKVAELLPEDAEAQRTANDANEAVIAKRRADERLLSAANADPTGAINRLIGPNKKE